MAGPGRPNTVLEFFERLNGSPIFLGSLVSTGTAVNNATTATPFNFAGLGPVGSVASPKNLQGTLAGKLLLLQPTVDGLILGSTSSLVTITPQSGAQPGIGLGSGERVNTLMLPTMGWMQWIPISGPGTCLVWEML